MPSRLSARVQRLERRIVRSSGCQHCGGLAVALYLLDDNGNWSGRPDYVADDGRCSGCGTALKAYLKSDWDLQ
jgi:hypothetical protein